MTAGEPGSDPDPPPGPDMPPKFALLEEVAVWRGLPPEPWLPD